MTMGVILLHVCCLFLNSGVSSYFYHPCADDIGCRICVQCTDAFDQGYSRYAETECIVASAKLKDAVERHLSHNHIELPWTLHAQPLEEGIVALAAELELERKSAVSGKRVSGRLDLGGSRIIKKKKK